MRKSAAFMLSFIIALIMAVPIIAEAVYVYKCFEYTEEDNSVTITGYYGRDSEITVPPMIAGTPVNIIASGAFTGCRNVTVINLPDTITTIENGAFADSQTVKYDSNISKTPIKDNDTESTDNTITAEIPESSQTITTVSENTINAATVKTTSVSGIENITSISSSDTDKTESGEETDIDFIEETKIADEPTSTPKAENVTQAINKGEKGSDTNNKAKTLVIIAISVSVAILIIFSVFIVKKKNEK